MKTYVIHKKYASIEAARKNRKLSEPVRLGEIEASSAVEAVKKAAKKFDRPQMLLSARLK